MQNTKKAVISRFSSDIHRDFVEFSKKHVKILNPVSNSCVLKRGHLNAVLQRKMLTLDRLLNIHSKDLEDLDLDRFMTVLKTTSTQILLYEEFLLSVLQNQDEANCRINPLVNGPKALWKVLRNNSVQFLGPTLQYDIIDLVHRAFSNMPQGLSRHTLVEYLMYILKKNYPKLENISRTSVGHVVQILYSAGCFDVIKVPPGMPRPNTSPEEAQAAAACSIDAAASYDTDELFDFLIDNKVIFTSDGGGEGEGAIESGGKTIFRLKKIYFKKEQEAANIAALCMAHDIRIITLGLGAGVRLSIEQWTQLLYGPGSVREKKAHVHSAIDQAINLIQVKPLIENVFAKVHALSFNNNSLFFRRGAAGEAPTPRDALEYFQNVRSNFEVLDSICLPGLDSLECRWEIAALCLNMLLNILGAHSYFSFFLDEKNKK